MTLPAGVSSHHTVWVHPPGAEPHPLRYAVDGDRLICFGDGMLDGISDGARVSVTIHEIAGGHEVAAFGVAVRDLPAAEVPTEALLELLAHVPLGRNLDDVEQSLARYRDARRVVALVA
jgi:hypothetical protein